MSAASAPARWPVWPYLAFLATLALGPLIAPLFQATRLPLLAGSGALARDMLSSYICPTPAKSYLLLGFPMAVCARCWGATLGLWAAWLFVRWPLFAARRDATSAIARSSLMLWRARYLALAWPLRAGLAALPFGLWAAEISRWPAAPYWALLINGAFAGAWAGLLFCSVWPGMAGPAQKPQTHELC